MSGSAVPRQRRPAHWAPAGEWRLYRAWGDLPRESGWRRRFLAWLLGGWQQLLYIGITSRTAVARWAEHLGDKRFAPEIACWERDRRVYRREADVLAAERAAIIAERPVHNVQHNGNNPGAVRVRRHLPRHVVAARVRWATLASLWLALTVVLWWAAGWVDLPYAAGGAAAGIAGVKVWRRTQRRR